MKIKLYLLGFILLTVNRAYSFPDTTYLNKNWQPCKKDTFTYYRVVNKPYNARYIVRDYYRNDTMLMKGTFNDDVLTIKDGAFFYYDTCGYLTVVGLYINNRKQSEWQYFFKGTDSINFSLTYANDTNDGFAKYYHKNGVLKKQGSYKKDKIDGTWTFFDKDGKSVEATKEYNNGQYRGRTIYYDPFGNVARYEDSNGAINYPPRQPGIKYSQLDKPVVPPVNIVAFINKNVHHAVFYDIKEEQVYQITLIVHINGRFWDILFLDNNDEEYEDELKQTLYTMPRWKPATLHGKPIPYYYELNLHCKNGKFWAEKNKPVLVNRQQLLKKKSTNSR
jgi:hypothetical protein